MFFFFDFGLLASKGRGAMSLAYICDNRLSKYGFQGVHKVQAKRDILSGKEMFCTRAKLGILFVDSLYG